MRFSTRAVPLILIASALSACSDTNASRPGPTPNTSAWTMKSAGTGILQVTAPADVKGAATDGTLRFAAKDYEVQFWLIPGAASVDEGISRSAGQITDEFKDFATEKATDLTIAGAPAKRLLGTGHEADDGDAGSADLIIFKVGDHVFVACYHGESLTPAGQQGLRTLAQTATLP